MSNYEKPGNRNYLEDGDKAAAAVQKTRFRISLAFIAQQIADEQYLEPPRLAPQMTILAITLKNGFVVIGKSVPADPLNYDAQLGRQFARDDCIRQLWPLFAFALREHMSRNIDFNTLQEPPQPSA
jgi:hypothetical protein